uniref:Uncharacterized protein n=1 Tax=Leptocylindrus danicus TaxID=163516 RepID=A0A7S2KE03_9STRA|mmetsp:Transcript_21792/g.32591  ORF Transcript_21792/g.32591 Transcript_21792/m.32591 type:complete len:119 (+) Transcript_21792:109-465(+)
MGCCGCSRTPTAPNEENKTDEPLLGSGTKQNAPKNKRMGERLVTDLSAHTSEHSGKSSVLDPLDDSNLHEALHWDKILQKPDDSSDSEPTFFSDADASVYINKDNTGDSTSVATTEVI